jgi:uncharacterized protein YhbP (UPF0306 family)
MSMSQKNPRPSDPAVSNLLRHDILAYLAAHNVMTIASCDQNVPWAAAVFYASDEFDLYFFSKPKSRHGGNMAANSIVSAAIHEDYRDWRAIRGIQLEGRAERLRSLRLQARFWEVYLRKFPFVKEFFPGGGPSGGFVGILKSKLAGIRLYRIVPRTVYYIDNSQAFGHREMLDLSG